MPITEDLLLFRVAAEKHLEFEEQLRGYDIPFTTVPEPTYKIYGARLRQLPDSERKNFANKFKVFREST